MGTTSHPGAHLLVSAAHASALLRGSLLAVIAMAGALVSVVSVVSTEGSPALVGVSLALGMVMVCAWSAALRAAGRTSAMAVRARVRARGASGHVDAASAYWCAVPVPRRPRLPRAPGRG